MHAVYYVRPGENEELRYSLRSLDANTTVDRVTIVGGYPEWLNLDTVEVLPGNPYEIKQMNGLANMFIALEKYPGDFVVFNDDFIILQPMQEPLPYFHKYNIDNHANQVQTHTPEGRARKKMLSDMSIYLKTNGVPSPLSFETHIPMRINGEKLLGLINRYKEWHGHTREEPLVWRSLYGNKAPETEKVGRRDVILYGAGEILNTGDYASTADHTVAPILPELEQLFPTPSRWEK